MSLRLIALTLKEWGYSNKAHLRGLNSAHLYKEMVLLIPCYNSPLEQKLSGLIIETVRG